MNQVTETDTGFTCSCGASCNKKDKNRFRRRHPKLCSERKAFNIQLAQGTRCLDEEGFDCDAIY